MNSPEGEEEDDFGNFEGADVGLEFNYDLFDRIIGVMEVHEEVAETNLIDLLSSTADSFKMYNRLTSSDRQVAVHVPILAVNTQNQMKKLNIIKTATNVVNNWISDENRNINSKSNDSASLNIFQWRIDGADDVADYNKEQKDHQHDKQIDLPQKNLSEVLLNQASKSCNRLQVQRQLEQREMQLRKEKKFSNTPEVEVETNEKDTSDLKQPRETKKKSKWQLFGTTRSKKSIQISKDHIRSDNVKVEKDTGLAFKDELNFKEHKSKHKRKKDKDEAEEEEDSETEAEDEEANNGYAILGDSSKEREQEEETINDFVFGEASAPSGSPPTFGDSITDTNSTELNSPLKKFDTKDENLIDL